MNEVSLSQRERRGLVELCVALGPDAPTLCDPWTTADMVSHLYVRENRPKALPGIAGGKLEHLAAREMDEALAEYGYGHLLEKVLDGPPIAMRLVDSAVNTLEYFVHHEDVRRAQPAEQVGVGPIVRNLALADRQELARRIGPFLAMLPPPSELPAYLQATDLPDRTTWLMGSSAAQMATRVRGVFGGGGTPSYVTRVVGPVSEIVMWAFGRTETAQVRVSEEPNPAEQ